MADSKEPQTIPKSYDRNHIAVCLALLSTRLRQLGRGRYLPMVRWEVDDIMNRDRVRDRTPSQFQTHP